jgi:tetratricopeptide (TPR) repeat protein
VLTSATEKRMDYPEPWNAIGIAYLENHDYDRAQTSFSKAIQLGPDWAYPRHNLALTFVEKGDYAAAEAEYREAIRRTPYQPYLYYNLGVLLHRINRKADAKTEYNLAITVFEDQAKIALEHETRFSEDGDATEAQRSRDRRATLLKNEAEAYNALGALAQANGHASKARDAYNAAIMHNPDLPLPPYNLGILNEKKNPDTAIGLWQKVLAIDKDYLPAHQRLAETWHRLGKFEESAAEYREVLRLQPDNLDTKSRLPEVLGDLNAAKGNKAEACTQYSLAESSRAIEKKKKRVC